MTPDLLPERIASRIAVDDNGCWKWQAYVSPQGYGRITYQNRGWQVHRLVYEMLVGAVPAGLELDHLCRVRDCCSPHHLEAVTHSTNIMRSPFGGAKTHCKHGHEYVPANTYINTQGRRVCRTCLRAYWQRRKALKASA